MPIDDCDVYGGFAGAPLRVDHYDLGRGITLSRTYAHLMAPFVMAFAPAEPGQPHPAPWRAAKGGFGFDVLGQVHVPRDFAPPRWFDRLNTVWWFVALLRFRASPYLLVPVLANRPFAEAVEDDDIHFWPAEVEQRLLIVERDAPREILIADLDWIKLHWWDAGRMMRDSGEFNLLFQACAQCIFTRNPALALLSLWGALEGMFSPAKTELRFRVSANIAAFLEAPGPGRLELQMKVAKLYDARSQAAHGGTDLPDIALADTYALTKRVLTKVIETNHVPSREDLDAALFGAPPPLG
ncbi:MAG TPA: hypothetical protein VJ739_18600 [Gemmataceae bacterium]|nr:hypothetical protein [Gemmataceae bacterium]